MKKGDKQQKVKKIIYSGKIKNAHKIKILLHCIANIYIDVSDIILNNDLAKINMSVLG